MLINGIPDFLYDSLLKQYGEELTKKIIEGYTSKRNVSFRVNTLKANVQEIEEVLDSNDIEYSKVSWNEEAFLLDNAVENDIRKLDIYEEGKIYLQSLSSMIPAIIVNPIAEENILDMAAAPGGKTTQMAALSNNQALITACEKNKIRAERLKYNLEKQGASKVSVLNEDSRNLSEYFSFDKILLDAPCSGSGTISIEDKELEKVFTRELVNRSVKTQYNLLKKAASILKSGHEMVYSTCSILHEENESNLIKILKENKLEIVPIDKSAFEDIPLLPVSLDGTICVCPTKLYEGFFVAKLRKRKG